MRGSPLFRTFFLLLLLAATGTGLVRLTGRAPAPQPAPEPPPVAEAPTATGVAFELTFGAVPAAVEILDATGKTLYQSISPDVRQGGTLALPASGTTVVLHVRWAAAPAGHRFAKMVLEPPGRPTLRHVFDATGDIDDAWEIPTADANSVHEHD